MSLTDLFQRGINTDLSKDSDYQNLLKQQRLQFLQTQAQQADQAVQANKNQSLASKLVQYGPSATIDTGKKIGSLAEGFVKPIGTALAAGPKAIGENLAFNTNDTNSARAAQSNLADTYSQLAQRAAIELRNPNNTPVQKAQWQRILNSLPQNISQNTQLANQATQQTINRTNPKALAGDAAIVASLGIGGGQLADAYRAGKLTSAVAGTLASGALGGAGNAAQNNQNTKQILEQAGIGGALGLGAGILSAGAGELASKLKNKQAVINNILDESKIAPITDTSHQLSALTTSRTQELNNQLDQINQRLDEVKNGTTPNTTFTPSLPSGKGTTRLSTNTPLTQQTDNGLSVGTRGTLSPSETIKSSITGKEIRALQTQRKALLDELNNSQKVNPYDQLNNVEERIAAAHANNVNPQIAQNLQAERNAIVQNIQQNDIGGQIVENQSKLSDSIKAAHPDLAPEIQTFTHQVHNQQALEDAAKATVAKDPVAANDLFSSGSLAQINPDAHIKLGQQLANQAAEQGDTKALNQILAEHQSALTNHAQAMRAAGTVNILNPDSLIAYAAKKADQAGKPLPIDLVDKLKNEVSKLNQMPDGPEKTLAMNKLKDLAENKSLFRKGVDLSGRFAASARAIMASTDLSGGLRQGGVFATRFPVIAAKAEAVGAKAAFSQAAFKEEVSKFANLTDAQGVPLSGVFKRMGINFGNPEEMFSNASLAEGKVAKKFGVGHVIQGSDRAYATTLEYMRAYGVKELIDAQGGVEAVTKNWNSAQFKALGRVVDTITGRGRGGAGASGKFFENAAPTLSKTFFSARLWKSRLDLLNPAYYAEVSKNPVALRLALRSGAQFATTVGLVLGAAAAAGAKVETDLRSSDFGKIKIGDTRIDIMGGLQQNLVLAWRELSGQYKSSTTGNVSDLNSNVKGAPNRLTIAGRTVESKLAPVLGEIITQIKGVDMGGNPMNTADRLKSVAGLGIPLSIQDTYSAIKDKNSIGGLGAAGAGFVGLGVNTYGNTTGNEWNNNTSKQITQFKQTVNPQDFQAANQKFDQQYSAWLQNVQKDPRYQKLNLKDQQTVRTNKSNKLKADILKSYGFTYKNPSNNATKGF